MFPISLVQRAPLSRPRDHGYWTVHESQKSDRSVSSRDLATLENARHRALEVASFEETR